MTTVHRNNKRQKPELKIVHTWRGDPQAAAAAMQYLADLADRYEAEGRLVVPPKRDSRTDDES